MALAKWQRNAIFAAVLAGGIDPAECTLKYNDERTLLTHEPSQSYLLLSGRSARVVVGDSTRDLYEISGFDRTEEVVRQWADEVAIDVVTPDRWADLERERNLLTGVGYEQVENTLFSTAEQNADCGRDPTGQGGCQRDAFAHYGAAGVP